MTAIARRPVSRHTAPVPAFAELFEHEQQRLPGSGATALDEWRRTRFARFNATGLPTQRVEHWKYTNIAKVANVAMGLASRPEVRLDDVQRYFAGGPLARRLIFVNGHLATELSHVGGLPEGVVIKGLDAMLREQPDRVLAALAEDRALDASGPHSFADLNAAFLQSGAWIEVADDVVLERPIQLLFLTVGEASAVMTHPHIVLKLGARAKAHLIESHVGVKDGHCLTNLVADYEVGAGAYLAHDRLQLGAAGTTFIGLNRIRIGEKGELKQTVATLGGGLVRNETDMHLQGSFIEAQLNGVYMPIDSEHVDNVIRVHHEQPDGHSDQFYKGVALDKAKAAFAGKIFVYKDAQRTNAFQTNNNLLLSDDAEIDSKPELEIYADDVKCSHGATCGELDPVALFYLRSRGLDRDAAESLLTYAFAAEVLERFTDTAVMKLAQERLIARTPGGTNLTDML
jgi:Fe-S cluster assembly protein SufD